MRLSYITDRYEVSTALDEIDMKYAAEVGFKIIINNRRDGEDVDQVPSKELEKAAIEAGLIYYHIPTKLNNETDEDIIKLREILESSDGMILGFCKSGMRARVLHSKATDTPVIIRKCGFCH